MCRGQRPSPLPYQERELSISLRSSAPTSASLSFLPMSSIAEFAHQIIHPIHPRELLLLLLLLGELGELGWLCWWLG
jgi:hypothetical protein